MLFIHCFDIYMHTIIYQFFNPITIFSGLFVSYIAGNKTKNMMFGPPTTIVLFYKRTKRISFNLSGERGEKERCIETDLPWAFRTVTTQLGDRRPILAVAEACWWAWETVSVNHTIFLVPIKLLPFMQGGRKGFQWWAQRWPVKERSDGAEWRWAIARNSLKRLLFLPPSLHPLSSAWPEPETSATNKTPLNLPAKALDEIYDPSSGATILLPSFLPSLMKGLAAL